MTRAETIPLRLAPSARTAERESTLNVLGFLAAHVLLGLILSRARGLGVLHLYGSVLLGLWWCRFGRRADRAACVAAYIVGAEVLWRMLWVFPVWEFGKYATAAILLLAIGAGGGQRGTYAAPVFIGLLLVSAPLTLAALGVDQARRGISSNLSGPMLLAVSLWFFSSRPLSVERLRTVLVAALGPILAIATVTALGTYAGGPIEFGTESNFATSGGFGPNQVSTILGLGALLAFAYIHLGRVGSSLGAVMVGLTLVCAAQSAMTFSRGGLLGALGGLLVFLLLLQSNRSSRSRGVFVTFVLAVVAAQVVYPALDAFTGGALTARFQKHDLTNRDTIMRAQLRVWSDNPLLGVGPGMAPQAQAGLLGHRVASHTEFTRLLAEHGLFGLVALAVLLAATVASVARSPSGAPRALAAAAAVWALLSMVHAAMRTAAPGFVMGLASMVLLSERSRGCLPGADRPPQPQVPARRWL